MPSYEYGCMDLSVLRSLARYHKRILGEIEAVARLRQVSQHQEKRSESGITEIRAAAQKTMALIDSGIDPRAAIVRAAQDYGFKSETIEANLKRLIKNNKILNRKLRDARIADLRAAGISAARIAKVVNCHRNTVSRTAASPFFAKANMPRRPVIKSKATELTWPGSFQKRARN